ncbi:hypothetical protein [Arthrobacter sp. H35-D1]|uniref:hypothetical protein n=1 Tax=Arthrobacter sp. H35-D1 TaxID=3046202 RepID=UPI0024B92388|nr:hypothetical protein [Arthrobacter sp. H35-D1]MDJ0314548.1 hypothetical protein [Arthrobacter sp. H35-D1]
MRTAGSAILVILALVLAAAAGPSLWLQRHIVDEAGFVELAGPLGSDEEFQGSLTATLSSQAAASVDLPPVLNALAVEVINSAVRAIYTDPGYPEAWSQTLQRSHALTFKAAENSEVAGDVQLDIAPLVGLVAAKVSADVGVDVPTPEEVVVTMDQPQMARALPLAATLGSWSGAMVLISAGLLVLGVVVARRRSLTVIAGGVGLALVALLWVLASSLAETFLSGLATGPESATVIGSKLAQLSVDSWQGGITATFILAAAVAVAGVASLVVARTRST